MQGCNPAMASDSASYKEWRGRSIIFQFSEW